MGLLTAGLCYAQRLNNGTVKPCFIATIGKREFRRYNEFGDRSRSGFLPVTCQHSKMCMRYW